MIDSRLSIAASHLALSREERRKEVKCPCWPTPSRRRRRSAIVIDRSLHVHVGWAGGHLPTNEGVVDAVKSHELVVRAALRDATSLHDNDHIGRPDGREAVGHYDRRAIFHQPIDRLLDHMLALSVQSARRLVEEEHVRIDEQRPRDGDALLLTAGELHATLAHLGRVALREGAHKIVRIRSARRLDDRVISDRTAAVCNVLPHRARK
mmetsp:Transcript_67009/g.132815  ORF Transcript_67009/g.132815 Transcript_67009/m.132815 type:complete len:208 (-) Transcript_67009:1003-1626(-)